METRMSALLLIRELLKTNLGSLKLNPRLKQTYPPRHRLFWRETGLLYGGGPRKVHFAGRRVPKRRDREGS